MTSSRTPRAVTRRGRSRPRSLRRRGRASASTSSSAAFASSASIAGAELKDIEEENDDERRLAFWTHARRETRMWEQIARIAWDGADERERVSRGLRPSAPGEDAA